MRGLWREVWPFTKGYRIFLIILSLIDIIHMGLQLLLPYLESQAIHLLSIGKSWKAFTDILIYFLILQIFILFLYYIGRWISAKLNLDISFAMISYRLEGMEESKIEAVNRYESGFLANLISTDSNIILQFFLDHFLQFFLQIFIGIFVFLVIGSYSKVVAVIVVFWILIYIGIYFLYRGKIFHANEILRNQQDSYFQIYLKRIESLLLIKIHSLYEVVNEHLRLSFLSLRSAQLKEVGVSLQYKNIRSFLQISLQIFIFLYIGRQIFSGNLHLGDMLLLISYQSMLFSVVEYYFDFFEEMQVALVSKNRLKELSQLEKEEFGNKKLKTIDFLKGENLFYKYPNQEEEAFLLDSIKGEKGEIVRIEGENGKGKSSLIYYLLGILSNEETKNISYQEISFQDLSIKDFRQDHTFTVLQYPIFYHEKPKDLVENYMDWELFSEKTKEGVYPFDLRDLGDKYFQEMSYGQRQKWSILEAALANKSIVFFDEPTASLDGKSVNSFVRWLGEFKKNKITFLISHDARLNGLEEKRIHL